MKGLTIGGIVPKGTAMKKNIVTKSFTTAENIVTKHSYSKLLIMFDSDEIRLEEIKTK